MSRKSSDLLEYGIGEEIDPKLKFNLLISVTVSTIMCLAAGCPLPKSNVETTKLFLSTVTDDDGHTPRNIKGFLSLLNDYKGPYELQESPFEEPSAEEMVPKIEKKYSFESVTGSKAQSGQVLTVKEFSPGPETHILTKRNSKVTVRKEGKDTSKKGSKGLGSKIATSKSMISSKL